MRVVHTMNKPTPTTWCGACGEAMVRTTEHSMVFETPTVWAAYTCKSPSCSRVYATVLQIGHNKDKPKSLVGDSFVLKKGYFTV